MKKIVAVLWHNSANRMRALREEVEKIAQVQELVSAFGQTLEEAGSTVGIKDTKYLSALFRKYTGMTVTEFRRAGKLPDGN